MPWSADQLVGGCDFHQPPQIHDCNPGGDLLHHAQIMRDKDHGEAEVSLKLGQKIDDLSLHRDIQRRNGLVTDQKLRFQDQGPRNTDPLALSVCEFTRVVVDQGWRQANLLHCVLNLGAHVCFRRAGCMRDKRLGDDISDRHAWVQR